MSAYDSPNDCLTKADKIYFTDPIGAVNALESFDPFAAVPMFLPAFGLGGLAVVDADDAHEGGAVAHWIFPGASLFGADRFGLWTDRRVVGGAVAIAFRHHTGLGDWAMILQRQLN
jgi:hypothetical protein